MLAQTDRILLVLLDGGWHSTREILREVPSIVHSRISDLRATGLTIQHRTTGQGAAGSWYRLLGSPGGETAETADVVAAPGDPSSSPLSEPPVVEVQERAGSRQPVGASRPRPFSLGNDNGWNQAGGSLSGASAHGREDHGRPRFGRESDDPSDSPPAQISLLEVDR